MYTSRIKVPSRSGTFIKTFDKVSRRRIHARHGKNSANVEFLITSWVTLISDSPNSPSTQTPNKVYNKFFNELVDDLFGCIELFDGLSDMISTTIYHSEEGLSIKSFIPEMKKTPIFKEYLHWYNDPYDFSSLTYILSFLSFGKKLYYEDSELNTTAFRGWLEVEEKLRGVQFEAQLIEAVRHVVASIFDNWSFGPFLPKHGNGRVAEQGISGSEQKNSNFPSSRKIEYLLKMHGVLSHGCEISRVLPDGEAQKERPPTHDKSRLKFVPKNWKKTRSICMEPIIYQWAQQAVRLGYEAHLANCLLSPFVTIRDQGNNQDGAKFGSESGLVDTIDLSSASDSVSWKLVKQVFPAKILKLLAATRTSVVETGFGDPIEVEKFAPMGSALCFPVQSTLYAAVVIVASIAVNRSLQWDNLAVLKTLDIRREVNEIFFSHFTFEHNKLYPFRVYGDDIVCDTRTTSLVIRMLQSLGFTINEEKSFVDNQAYRESCGKHYCDGVEVTPYYFKIRKIGSSKVRIDSMAGIIDHCNKALDYGFLNLRRHLKNFILFYPILNNKLVSDKGENAILFSNSEDDTFAIRSENVRNAHLKRRIFDPTDPDPGTTNWYQRDEVLSLTVATKDKIDHNESYDNYHYLAWQRSHIYRGKTDSFESGGRYDAVGTRIARRWTPG